VALGYTDFRYAHDWRTSHPQLAAWFAKISERSWFIETRPPSG
jgi:glutathione S-transferase